MEVDGSTDGPVDSACELYTESSYISSQASMPGEILAEAMPDWLSSEHTRDDNSIEGLSYLPSRGSAS